VPTLQPRQQMLPRLPQLPTLQPIQQVPELKLQALGGLQHAWPPKTPVLVATEAMLSEISLEIIFDLPFGFPINNIISLEFHRATSTRTGTGVAIGVRISATNESKRSMPPLKIHQDRSEPRRHDYTHDYNNHSTACHSCVLTKRSHWEDALKWWCGNG